MSNAGRTGVTADRVRFRLPRTEADRIRVAVQRNGHAGAITNAQSCRIARRRFNFGMSQSKALGARIALRGQ